MENKKTVNFLIVLNVILILVSGFLAWKLYNTKTEIRIIEGKKNETNIERNELKTQLDSLVREHEKLKVQYGALNNRLSEKDQLIQSKIEEINSLINNKGELSKIKKKMDALRRITQSYVHQIDSLFVVNKTLKEENVKVKNDFKTAQLKSEELEKDKVDLTTKVNNAAVLKAFKISGKGVRYKKRGTQEESANKAKKVEKLTISFTLLENSLLDEGNKNIFIRIAGPDGKILCENTQDAYSFMYQGSRLQYTLKQVVNYDKKNQDITVFWKQSAEFQPGLYNIDIYSDEKNIGSGGFTLDK